MAFEIDAVFSLLGQSAVLYKNRDYDSLLGALKPLATLVVAAHKTYPKLSKERGSRLHEFAKKILHGGVQFVKNNPYLVGAAVVILVSSYALLQIYHLYNFAKQNLRKYEWLFRSLYENELKPTLEYINNKLLSDLENVDPDDFCDAAEHVVKMLDKLAARLMGLREQIVSSENQTWPNPKKFERVVNGGWFGGVVAASWCTAVVAPPVGIPMFIGCWLAGAGSQLYSSSLFPLLDGGMKFRLQTLRKDTERLYDMVAKSRTQIELTVAEMKRTRKQREEEKRKKEEKRKEEEKWKAIKTFFLSSFLSFLFFSFLFSYFFE